MQFDTFLQQFLPDRLPPGIFACGRSGGVFDFEQKLLNGRRAGLEAAAYLGFGESSGVAITPASESPSHPYPILAHPKGKNFVDFDEDLQLKDFHNAIQEGFDNIELLKRFSTVGMGPSKDGETFLHRTAQPANHRQTTCKAKTRGLYASEGLPGYAAF